jgi:hypothetical protein
MPCTPAWSRAGVPDTDKFQRVLELDADDFRFDPLSRRRHDAQ